MGVEVVVLIPVLSRPARVEPLLASLRASQQTIPLRPLFIATASDLGEIQALHRSGVDWIRYRWRAGPGDWAAKINLGYRMTEEPWLLLAADDLDFHPGWADAAVRTAERSRKRVVGTSDGGRNREARFGVFSPHPLVARSYVEEYGAGTFDGTDGVVSEAYDHNWPDRELAEVAKARGEWIFAKNAVVEHLHPNWPGGIPRDATYERGNREFRTDAALYRRRLTEFQRARRQRR